MTGEDALKSSDSSGMRVEEGAAHDIKQSIFVTDGSEKSSAIIELLEPFWFPRVSEHKALLSHCGGVVQLHPAASCTFQSQNMKRQKSAVTGVNFIMKKRVL